MKLTLNQRRFLIVWILFHSFALFVNLADIEGEVETSDNTTYFFTKGISNNNDFWPFTSYYSTTPKLADRHKTVLDSTTNRIGKKEPKYTIGIHSKTGKKVRIPRGIAESVKFFNNPINNDVDVLPTDNRVTDFSPIIQEVVGIEHSYYGGLFNCYGFPEYIFYILIGLCAVFIPKFWNNELDKK
jgi:hypothetical protein